MFYCVFLKNEANLFLSLINRRPAVPPSNRPRQERLQEAAVKAFGKAKQLAQRATSRGSPRNQRLGRSKLIDQRHGPRVGCRAVGVRLCIAVHGCAWLCMAVRCVAICVCVSDEVVGFDVSVGMVWENGQRLTVHEQLFIHSSPVPDRCPYVGPRFGRCRLTKRSFKSRLGSFSS